MNTPHCTNSVSFLSGIKSICSTTLEQVWKATQLVYDHCLWKGFWVNQLPLSPCCCILALLPHDVKSGPGVPGCCWLLLACLGSHDGRSPSFAVNVSFLAHIAHTEPLLPREGKKKNTVYMKNKYLLSPSTTDLPSEVEQTYIYLALVSG